jgi:hypothetical protein
MKKVMWYLPKMQVNVALSSATMHVSEGSINHKTILPVDAESYNFENH